VIPILRSIAHQANQIADFTEENLTDDGWDPTIAAKLAAILRHHTIIELKLLCLDKLEEIENKDSI
jgi:hypothetical protein